MKKIVTAIALVVAIGFLSNSADARWGKSQGSGYGPGSCGSCDQNTAVDAEARETFFAETEDLRNQLMDKRSEYFAMMNSEDTDKDLAQDLWSEMFDLQQQLQAKAEEAGMAPNAGRGAGKGRGCGGGNNGQGCGSFGGNGQGCSQNNYNAPTQ